MSLEPESINPRHAAMAEDDQHPAWRDLPPRRTATNYGDMLDRAKEDLAEEIHIARDHLAQLEHEYAQLDAVEIAPDPDPSTRTRPGVDPRVFASAGTDEVEQWREDAPAVRLEAS